MTVEAVPADTTPEAARVQWDIFRRMSPSKRLELALRMSDSLRDVVASGVRDRHHVFIFIQRRTVHHLKSVHGDRTFRKFLNVTQILGCELALRPFRSRARHRIEPLQIFGT